MNTSLIEKTLPSHQSLFYRNEHSVIHVSSSGKSLNEEEYHPALTKEMNRRIPTSDGFATKVKNIPLDRFYYHFYFTYEEEYEYTYQVSFSLNNPHADSLYLEPTRVRESVDENGKPIIVSGPRIFQQLQPGVRHIFSVFEQAVLGLPEFRLLHATGLLKPTLSI